VVNRNSQDSFTGVILAAGRGERLRSPDQNLPKPLVRLDGHPLLVRQAELMLQVGAASITSIVNSETALILEQESIELPAGLRLVVRDTPNSMESMFAVEKYVPPGWFLMTTVDAVVARPELTRFVEAALHSSEDSRRFDGVLALTRWRGDKRPLFAHLDDTGKIVSLGADPADLVTAGVYFLHSRIFEFTAPARAAGLGALREFLALLIQRGFEFRSMLIDGAIDIDEAADLTAAEALLATSRHTVR
jgi:NDP-sugar pyrophosphorylase family protein